MKGLKADPGWRQACVTWLNLFLSKSKPPTSARTAPVRGSIATSAPSTSGSCVSDHCPFGPLRTRTTAPRRICTLVGAFAASPEVTGRSPSPVAVIVSPDCSIATTLPGDASSTTAALRSSLSG